MLSTDDPQTIASGKHFPTDVTTSIEDRTLDPRVTSQAQNENSEVVTRVAPEVALPGVPATCSSKDKFQAEKVARFDIKNQPQMCDAISKSQKQNRFTNFSIEKILN